MSVCIVAGVMFFKFWFRTRDGLFLSFAIAFWILAVDWVVLAMLRFFVANPSEHNALVYSVRLLAFVIILVGIVAKNRSSRDGSRQEA